MKNDKKKCDTYEGGKICPSIYRGMKKVCRELLWQSRICARRKLCASDDIIGEILWRHIMTSFEEKSDTKILVSSCKK